MEVSRTLWVIFLALAVLIWQVWFATRGRMLKKTVVRVKQPVAPEEHISFLVDKYKYDKDLATEVWFSIKESSDYEDFYATRIFAHKLHEEWFVRLSAEEKAKYEWKMRNSDLEAEMKKESEYQFCRLELINFIRSVRSYAG